MNKVSKVILSTVYKIKYIDFCSLVVFILPLIYTKYRFFTTLRTLVKKSSTGIYRGRPRMYLCVRKLGKKKYTQKRLPWKNSKKWQKYKWFHQEPEKERGEWEIQEHYLSMKNLLILLKGSVKRFLKWIKVQINNNEL